MALEMGLWRTDGGAPKRIAPTALALESMLENYIEADPVMLGETLLIIGRQVSTAHGGFIGLLALDETGSVHVIELKRDRTPRDVTAQTLDYGSWVSTLGASELHEIFANYRPATALEEAFGEVFSSPLPEELNATQTLTIVAANVDSATERIVRFLNEDYGVPINVVFFRNFVDNGASYLARTWLVDSDAQAGAGASASRRTKTRESWNGTDWYVSFGAFDEGRQWVDAQKYGFISAGGGKWFIQTLKNLPLGARILVHIPKEGYVGVGTVIAEAQRFDQAHVMYEGEERVLKDQQLVGTYRREGDEDDDLAEWVVAVEWQKTLPREMAFWKPGMFANQNTATRLRHQFTISQVSQAFDLDD